VRVVDIPGKITYNAGMSRIKFPYTVRREGTTLTATIYRRETIKQTKEGPREYTEYTLAYYQDGQRKTKTSADFDALVTSGKEILADLKEGRSKSTLLTVGERNDYALAIDILKPTGIPLTIAAQHFAKAVEILGSDLVVQAAQEYVSRHLDKIKPIKVSDAVTELLAEKEAAKKSAVHIARLRIHLNRFAAAMQKELAKVTVEEMDLFLDSLKDADGKRVGERTRDNHADSIVTLYRWAQRKRYVAADYDDMERITRLDSDEDGDIEIYRPAELAALLSNSSGELVPFLAIGAFAGLRSSEILRLDWADVKIENGSSCIVVQRGKVKKRGKSRRVVPMTENLKAWITPHAKKSGPVWEHSQPLLYRGLQDLVPAAQAALQKENPAAKLEWKPNALRHSFISYRVHSVQNVNQVALEAGNSPDIVFSNYRELVDDASAKAWFGIMPEGERLAKDKPASAPGTK
jgi:integrase